MTNIALVGYGLIAEAHAAAIAAQNKATITALIGPRSAEREAFAKQFGIAHVAEDLTGIGQYADAAIIASPSHMHFSQSASCLEAGLHVLAEIPPAGTQQELERLFALAHAENLVFQSTRTSAFIAIYRRIAEIIAAGSIGELASVHYHRTVPPRVNAKKWTDDALLHHAAHPLDLFFRWFGEVRPINFTVLPDDGAVQELALVAEISNAIASVVISYGARVEVCDLTIVGTRHTLRCSGFSKLVSDNPDLCWQADDQNPLIEAVTLQDREFIQACRGENLSEEAGALAAVYNVIFEARKRAKSPAALVQKSKEF